MSMKSHIAIVATVLAALAGQGTRAAANGPPSSAATSQSAGTSSETSETSETLQEVTVTAHHLELEKRVSKFVAQIAVMENGAEGLARWQKPSVCPLVSGLPQQDGEFILERVSEIARASGVPLAAEHCRPNFYILVTDQPEDLLRAMEKRDRRFTFGYDATSGSNPPAETRQTAVDAFIKTPRAVRVWYNAYERDDWGQPIPLCPFGNGEYIQCPPAFAGGTRALLSTTWAISTVFVVADQARLHKVKLGQLADYVAMTGFAKLKPEAHLDNAPTILTLFDGTPEAAPAGMTDWDETFLKSLYATDQKSKNQRSQIARHMVRDMTH
jgi:hypothetical protein